MSEEKQLADVRAKLQSLINQQADLIQETQALKIQIETLTQFLKIRYENDSFKGAKPNP